MRHRRLLHHAARALIELRVHVRLFAGANSECRGRSCSQKSAGRPNEWRRNFGETGAVARAISSSRIDDQRCGTISSTETETRATTLDDGEGCTWSSADIDFARGEIIIRAAVINDQCEKRCQSNRNEPTSGNQLQR